MKIKAKKLIRNAAKCVKCNGIIESTHRHDFRYCECGALAVDGGLEYERRVGDIYNCIDLSEYEEIEREEYDWEIKARLDKEEWDRTHKVGEDK